MPTMQAEAAQDQAPEESALWLTQTEVPGRLTLTAIRDQIRDQTAVGRQRNGPIRAQIGPLDESWYRIPDSNR